MIKLITYNTVIDKFIEDTVKKLNKHRVKFIVSATSYVKVTEKVKCNGYFCHDPRELALAVKKPIKVWLPTLVHESCHFDQWLERDPIWLISEKYEPAPESEDFVFDWIKGVDISATENQVIKGIKIAKKLELNNEIRTYNKIKQYNLPINAELYAKRAGAYVSFYDFVAKYKKWYKIGHEPYVHPEILKMMPSKIQKRYNGLTPKLIKLFKECV